jgi:hypothetical protein
LAESVLHRVVKLPDTSESRRQRYTCKREICFINQVARKVQSVCTRYLHRRRPKMLHEQAPQLTRTYAHALG